MALKDVFKGLTGQRTPVKQQAQFLNDSPIFSQFGTDVYASDVVQSCVDAIATEISKLTPRHIRTDPNGFQTEVAGSVNRLFKFAPNELMSTRDFLEKITWLLYLNYNAFIYPIYDLIPDAQGRQTRYYRGFYPLNPRQVDFLQDESGQLFARFYFPSSDFTIPYSEVIHLRKRYSLSDIMGGGLNGRPDNTALLTVLDTNDIILQGLGKAIKTSLTVRAILKINTLMDDAAQQKERARFEAALASGASGILPMDLKGEITPLNLTPTIIDKDTLEFLQNKVLNYYGVSPAILSGDFTDEQYQAFYEQTLEPIIISLGQAFSRTIFSDRELDVGNELAFYPQKLLFTNTKNRIAVADILGNRGAITNNALLDLFGYPPYEGGEKRYMSLNFADVDIANAYQMTRAGTPAIGTLSPGLTGVANDPLNITPTETGGKLNGAQVQSLITVVQSVKSGVLTKKAAIEIITSSFGISQEKAEKILDDSV